MFAIVEAEMSTSLSAPRLSRSGDSGALVFENGMDAASLMRTPRWRSESAFADALCFLIRSQARSSCHSRRVPTPGTLVILASAFRFSENFPNPEWSAQDSGRYDQVISGRQRAVGGRGWVLSRSTTSPG